MSRATVSAVIPTKNVAGIIRPTLESLQFCDEIVVVDMFSTDETRSVCESYHNIAFYQREDFIYGNFNYGVERAKSDWIIRIDSDEVISTDLRNSILAVLTQPEPVYTHYESICHLYFFGMRQLHGYGNQFRTTLFRKGSAFYEVKSEHEGLTTHGSAGKLSGHYDHFTNPTISTWMSKINYYTDKDVERSPSKLPMAPWKVIINMARNFRGLYFGKGQLRKDGYLGFTVALCSAFALGLMELKQWERYEKARLKALGKMPDHPNAW